MTEPSNVLVIGAGPAGLAAAHELLKYDIRPIVVEALPLVGGIARTEQLNGFRFDIGGHRFYTNVTEIDALWHAILGKEFEQRPRLSRIYYNGQFFAYPLKLWPTLRQLGVIESVRILASYLAAQLVRSPKEETFEQWVINRFGKRLFNTFFKSYTEKVWGIPTNEIQSEWAAQRIQGLSVQSAIKQALFKRSNLKTLIDSFHYPKHGPGMMWQAFQRHIQQHGGTVCCETPVTQLHRQGNRIVSVSIKTNHAGIVQKRVEQVISSMSLQNLIGCIQPAPPQSVQHAATGLKYRAFILVGLIINEPSLFPDNWIYIHEPAVQVGRIQNFKNWSPAMVPDAAYTSLGMEYFCNENDALWVTADDTLVALAKKEIVQLGLATASQVVNGIVIRQPKAYPVYDADYQTNLATIRTYLNEIENLQTIGRNGMHRYNNQDHSMLTGIFAAQNISGEKHDLWEINTEQVYGEIKTRHNEV